jgi:predicted porin
MGKGLIGTDAGLRLKVMAGALAACFALPAAADDASDLAALKAQVSQLTSQLQQVTTRLQQVEAAKTAAPQATPPAPVPQEKPARAQSLATSTDIDGRPITDENAFILYDSGNSSLTLYGIAEATISHVNHQTDGGGTASGFQVAYFSGNRLGFDMQHGIGKFGEKLGMPDLKLISRLETEYELPTGGSDTNGVLFNRDAWLGLYSQVLGKVSLGRQNTLTRDFTANWGDPFGGATVTTREGGYSNVNNFKQLIYYSAGPNGTRYNSAIEWKKEFDKNWLAGLAYAFGSGGNGGSADPGAGGSEPGDFNNGTAQAASVAYQNIPLGDAKLNLNASYDRGNKNHLIHQAFLVGGNVVYGPFRFNAGVIRYRAEQGLDNSAGTRTDTPWTVSMQYKPNAWEFDAGYQVLRGKHAGLSAGGITLNPFFGDTSNVTQTSDGSKTSIYAATRYNIDRHADIYLAADYFKVSDGWVVHDALGNGLAYGAGQTYNSETTIATGLRYKF